MAGWLVPSATLVLMPKCPVCVALYIALFSGISLSVAAASQLRTLVLALCIIALLCMAAKFLLRLKNHHLKEKH